MTAARSLPAHTPAGVVALRASNTPTADRLADALRDPYAAIGLGSSGQLPALADLEAAKQEVTLALASRPTSKEVRQVIGRLVLAYPQQARTESPEVYVAALESEAAGYPLDVLQIAARNVLRSSRFVPAVAELVQACEAEMSERRLLLKGAERLAQEVVQREAQRQEDERRERDRQERRQAQEAAIRARWGERVPAWFSIERAERGLGGTGRNLRVEGRAAEGDGPTFVMLRRAALYGLAMELSQASPPATPHLHESDVAEIAELLVNGRDAEAAAIVEVALEAPRPRDPKPPEVSWISVSRKALDAMSFEAVREAAGAEGLGELANH